MSLPDAQRSRRSSDDKALNILNAVMIFGLVLIVTLFCLWMIASSIGPASAILDQLTAAEQRALIRPALLLVPAALGIRVLWWGAARLLSAFRARQ